MRRFCFLLSFFILFFCFTSGAEARKLALLIGVDEYVNIQSLKCCVNDMKLLKEALMKVGFEEDDIQVLVTGGAYRNLPTKKRIEENISEMLSKAKPTDMVFLAFSGHGAQSGNTVYFCPPDTDLEDLDGTCISISKVMDDLVHCQAGFKWVVVDACRNDPFSTRTAKSLQVVPIPPEGIALFQSCAKGELSYEETGAGGNGYFTKNLAAALSGQADADNDGKLTLLEVCTWTADHTKADVMSERKETQTPFFSGAVSDFTIIEDLNVPKAKALVKEGQNALKEKNYELALKKFDAAIALCPQFPALKRKRDSIQKLLDEENKRREIEEKTKINKLEGIVKPGDKKTITVNGIDFTFAYCPAGRFEMGSQMDDEGKKLLSEYYNIRIENIEELHSVELTQGFWMLDTEVTVGMFKAFVNETGYVSVGTTPYVCIYNKISPDARYSWRNPGFTQTDNHPVTCISWEDATAFCRWLSRKTGLAIYLPTEAQWEYACRAGSTTALPNGNIEIKGIHNAPALDPIAWYGGNSSQEFTGQSGMNSSQWKETQYSGGPCGAHPVGKKEPNAWGLYDMIGNVWEWCYDWDGRFSARRYKDPIGPIAINNDCVTRVCRGGSWFNEAVSCRSAYRKSYKPEARVCFIGFRIVIRENGPLPENPVGLQSPMASNRLPVMGEKAGDRAVVTVNGVEFAFRWCPAGSFMMGASDSERKGQSRENDAKQHQVTLTRGFWIMETEVTQKQWKAIMVDNSVCKDDDDNIPIHEVSWDDVQIFCKECARLGFPVRLPTEAQWEYACRAGTTTAFFWGNDFNKDKANADVYKMRNNTDEILGPKPVGSYDPNPWGLYDMHGNVREWCADWEDAYPLGHVINPTGPQKSIPQNSDRLFYPMRIIRGGGWRDEAEVCSSYFRSGYYPWSNFNTGFRCVYGQ